MTAEERKKKKEESLMDLFGEPDNAVTLVRNDDLMEGEAERALNRLPLDARARVKKAANKWIVKIVDKTLGEEHGQE